MADHIRQGHPLDVEGHVFALTTAQRELLLDIRREHPTASAPLIVRTLVADGRLPRDAVLADHGRPRGVPGQRELVRANTLDAPPYSRASHAVGERARLVELTAA